MVSSGEMRSPTTLKRFKYSKTFLHNDKKILEHYLKDVLNQLLDEAFEERERLRTKFKDYDKVDDYDFGILHGYYAVILRLKNNTEAFNIEKKLPPRWHDLVPEEIHSMTSK